MFNAQEYRKRYYQENKEGMSEENRLWCQRNREHRKNYQKEYCEKNKEKLKKWAKQYRLKNIVAIRARQTAYLVRKREEALVLFGNKCFICGSQKRQLVFHEKNGNRHKQAGYLMALKYPEDFVLLCREYCHQPVHFMMKHLKMTWKEIEGRV